MIYLAILVLLMFLSFHYDVCGKKKNKEGWYLIVLWIFILFAGLRWRVGYDAIHYLHNFYHEYPSLSDFSFEEYYIGKDPFYVLLNSFVISIGGRFYMVQLIHAAFVNVLILNYFKRHSQYIFTCCVFYFLLSYISFSMEIMRASFSIVISLYAFDYFLDKKWVKGYALLLIALMFHAQTLALFLLPAFLFLRLNRKGLLMLIGAYLLGIFLQNLLADYVFLFEGSGKLEDKLTTYTSEYSELGKNTYNINYFIVKIFPKIFYPLFTLWYIKRYSKYVNLMRLEPIVMLGVIFALIQINYLIAYRYVEYFTIYFSIFYAETFINMIKKSKKIGIGVAYFKTILFMIPLTLTFLFLLKQPKWIYRSVLDKTVIKEAENDLKKAWIQPESDSYYPPNYNEY